jgi:hypothetical protein
LGFGWRAHDPADAGLAHVGHVIVANITAHRHGLDGPSEKLAVKGTAAAGSPVISSLQLMAPWVLNTSIASPGDRAKGEAMLRHNAPISSPCMSLVFPHTFVPWFRAVAPYIHAYRGKTFVVGLAGEAIAAGKLNTFVQDLSILHAMGIKLVLVHGFRPQVTEQLAAKGHVSRFSHGIRITDPVALDAAQEAAGQLRFEIEAAFSQGLPNTPMANSTVRVVSGNFLTARPVGIVDGVDFMHSGLVRRVDHTAMRRFIESAPWCC